ncbi:MAG: hypothetical protein HQL42_19290 [Alphaproteobacteria bacterium]|nr:hypothetical protein [Alphaproteobacteria bacterium]
MIEILILIVGATALFLFARSILQKEASHDRYLENSGFIPLMISEKIGSSIYINRSAKRVHFRDWTMHRLSVPTKYGYPDIEKNITEEGGRGNYEVDFDRIQSISIRKFDGPDVSGINIAFKITPERKFYENESYNVDHTISYAVGSHIADSMVSIVKELAQNDFNVLVLTQ